MVLDLEAIEAHHRTAAPHLLAFGCPEIVRYTMRQVPALVAEVRRLRRLEQHLNAAATNDRRGIVGDFCAHVLEHVATPATDEGGAS